jgi:hypothetical protein
MDSKLYFNIILIRTKTFVDNLCQINSFFLFMANLSSARNSHSIGMWKCWLSIEKTNWEEAWWCDLRYYPDIYLEEVGKKISVRIVLCQDVNAGPTDYKVGVQTTRPRSSVRVFVNKLSQIVS